MALEIVFFAGALVLLVALIYASLSYRFLRQRMRGTAAVAIAQRGVDQRDKKHGGAGEKDDLKSHGLLPVC